MLSGSFAIIALSNHTIFSQTQTGVTVPLSFCRLTTIPHSAVPCISLARMSSVISPFSVNRFPSFFFSFLSFLIPQLFRLLLIFSRLFHSLFCNLLTLFFRRPHMQTVFFCSLFTRLTRFSTCFPTYVRLSIFPSSSSFTEHFS